MLNGTQLCILISVVYLLATAVGVSWMLYKVKSYAYTEEQVSYFLKSLEVLELTTCGSVAVVVIVMIL